MDIVETGSAECLKMVTFVIWPLFIYSMHTLSLEMLIKE